MYLANLSQQNLFDFHLLELLANARTTLYNLTDSQLKFSAEASVNTDSLQYQDITGEILPNLPVRSQKLVVLGEGLNLEKLVKVQNALTAQLAFAGWQISPRATGIGVVAKACVTGTKSDINAKLDDIANQLHVEIALVDTPPVLTQGGLMVMDMDSTLIAVECIDEIAKLAGLGDKVAEITELAMQGKLDFKESLYNRVACLKGVDVSLLEGIRDRLPLMPGVSKLISHLHRHQWKIAIASGGFTFFADYLKARLNLADAVSNVLKVEDGKLTGEVIGAVVDANVKAQTLESLAQKFDVPAAQTIAVGDGANDLVMMQAAAFGVAYHAKPVVRQQASVAIRFGGLDTLLEYLD